MTPLGKSTLVQVGSIEALILLLSFQTGDRQKVGGRAIESSGEMAKTAFFAADQDEGAQRGSGRPIPPLVSEIQAATTNAGTKPQGDLTRDFLALSY
jgi:hypothetical protein